MAPTKCAWNAGSMAVSIFTIWRATPAISRPGRLRQQRADRAAPGRVADVARDRRIAVGDQAEHERVRGIDVVAERAREPDRVEDG